jgi:hypothetical protein
VDAAMRPAPKNRADAIALHTTPGIAAYKRLEVELLYNGVGLDVLGIGYEKFPSNLRGQVIAAYPRMDFKQGITKAFLGGFAHKTHTTEGTCNEDICSRFIRNYRRSDFYEVSGAGLCSPFFNFHFGGAETGSSARLLRFWGKRISTVTVVDFPARAVREA